MIAAVMGPMLDPEIGDALAVQVTKGNPDLEPGARGPLNAEVRPVTGPWQDFGWFRLPPEAKKKGLRSGVGAPKLGDADERRGPAAAAAVCGGEGRARGRIVEQLSAQERLAERVSRLRQTTQRVGRERDPARRSSFLGDRSNRGTRAPMLVCVKGKEMVRGKVRRAGGLDTGP